MAKFDDAAKFLEEAQVAGPASIEMIASGEARLGLTFPPSYRRFLERFGAALCAGFEIAGLFQQNRDDEPPLWSDVVTSTVKRRRVSSGLIPHEYIAISDDGGDCAFYLDTSSRGSEGEAPVVALGPGADGIVVAEDFPDFVIRSFEGSLAF